MAWSPFSIGRCLMKSCKGKKGYKSGGVVFNRGGLVPGTGDKKLEKSSGGKTKTVKSDAGCKTMCKGF